MDIKGSFVHKRVWRWVLISNYTPHEVFCTAPSGNGPYAVPAHIDMKGLFEPLYQRIIHRGGETVDGTIMRAVNTPGDYTRGCVVRSFNWMTGELYGEERSLGGFRGELNRTGEGRFERK